MQQPDSTRALGGCLQALQRQQQEDEDTRTHVSVH